MIRVPSIDLGEEWLIDTSKVRLPYLRLVLAAIGRPLARNSAWFAVRKDLAIQYPLPLALLTVSPQPIAGAA